MSETEPVLRRVITLILAGWLPPDLVSSRSCLCLCLSWVRSMTLSTRVYEGSPSRGCVSGTALERLVIYLYVSCVSLHSLGFCALLTLQKLPPHWQWPTWRHKVLGRWLLWSIYSLSPSTRVVYIGCIGEAGLSMIWHKYRAASLPTVIEATEEVRYQECMTYFTETDVHCSNCAVDAHLTKK